MKLKQCVVVSVVVFLPLLVSVRADEEVADLKSRLTHFEEWTLWKDTHKKSYETDLEELERHAVWLSNKKYIDLHNANARIFGFNLKMNHFGDMTDAEYVETYNTHTSEPVIDKEFLSNFKMFELPKGNNLTSYPESLDWRTKGAVGPVKNQLSDQCKSSYAFSALAALEGAYALSNGNYVSLSEQNLIDCSVPYGNNGCSGGTVHNAFTYIIANNGVNTAESYPYRARQSQCAYNKNDQKATMSGAVRIKSGDEESLLAAVNVGPVSVNIDASSNAFKFYYSGVFDSSQCSSYNVNHFMVATGYGTMNGKKYWLLKNSWGDTWGSSGYILMSRDKYNQCGIATDAAYPTP